jgi:galactokinase
MAVPTATSLRDIYPESAIPGQKERWESILAGFKDTYGKDAEFVARSPGRVNIIGEVRRINLHYSAKSSSR